MAAKGLLFTTSFTKRKEMKARYTTLVATTKLGNTTSFYKDTIVQSRGLWGRIKVNTIRGIIRKYDMQFVSLQETKMNFIDLDFCKRL